MNVNDYIHTILKGKEVDSMLEQLNLMLIEMLKLLVGVSVLVMIMCMGAWYVRLTNDGKIIKKRVVKTTKKKEFRGIIYGRKGHKIAYSPTEEENHVVVFGGTGSGKTYHILSPSLRSWISGTGADTFFALDIVERNQNVDKCEKNYSLADSIECNNKLVFEITNKNSIPYDLFFIADHKSDMADKIAEIEKICEILIGFDKDSLEQSTGNFFAQGGLELLKAIFIHYYFQGLDFPEICTLCHEKSSEELIFELGSSDISRARMKINRFEKLIENRQSDFSGIIDKVLSVTEPFLIDECNSLSKTLRRPYSGENCFNPSVLENKNVFLVIPDDKVKLYKIAVKLVVQQCLDYFSTRSTNSKTNILFAIDEYSTFNIDLTDALNKYRKRKVRILALTQSLMSLDIAVGELKRKSYLDNFQTKILLNVGEPDAQSYFARMIGMSENKRYSKSENSQDTTYSESEIRDFPISPDYLGRMTKTAIIINKNGWTELRKYKPENHFQSLFGVFSVAFDKWLLSRS